MAKNSDTQSDPFLVSNLNALTHRTPFLLIDLERLAQNYKSLNDALRGVDIFYAVKSNPEPNVIKTIQKLGGYFEIASANELDLLLSLEIPIEKIIYSNPVKPAEDIVRTFAVGMRCFALDSELEVEKLAKYAPGAEVYVRISVSDEGSAFPFAKKFGSAAHEAADLLVSAQQKGLIPYGLAFHVGSQATLPERWSAAIQTAGTVMRELQEKNIHVQMLDIGGGFPAEYHEKIPTIEEISAVIHESLEKHLPYRVRVIAEPGRGLVGSAGVIAATVIGRAKREGRHWLYLDIGAFNGMMESLLSNNELRYPVKTSIDAPGQEKASFTLTGPTCDSQDTMVYDVELPADITLNDRVYIMTTGAYTVAYASSFNGFGPPAVVCVDGDYSQ